MADLPNPKNRKELYLYDAATGRTGDLPSPKTREELYLNEIAENSGGSGGTSNYNQLSNKPKINNVELQGNKTLAELGIIDNTVSNLLNYYLKTETYTQAEVNALISAIVTLDIQAVSTLPTEDISTTTIYLVPKADAETDNVYDEYLYVSNAWELIGSTEIDLTNYVQKNDVFNYSTTEQVVGTWIDGKPLYQKTVNFGTLPNMSSKSVAHGISNIDKVIEIKGIAITTDLYQPIPMVNDASPNKGIAMWANNTNVTIRATNENYSQSYGYVTLRYTKTTD